MTDTDTQKLLAMARFASRNPLLLAGQVGGVKVIQTRLGCTYPQAVRLGLCLPPGHMRVDEWAHVLADFAGLTEEQARKLAQLWQERGAGRW